MLRNVWVAPGHPEHDRITALLPLIFPKEELSQKNIKEEPLPYLCFYEGDEFIGFAEVYKASQLYYLKYMAMLPQHRSKGYGGKMLELILSERGELPLALDIEDLDEKAANYDQRIRRFHFYRKHGLVDTGYIFFFGGNPYMLMSTGEENVPVLLQKFLERDTRYPSGYCRVVKR